MHIQSHSSPISILEQYGPKSTSKTGSTMAPDARDQAFNTTSSPTENTLFTKTSASSSAQLSSGTLGTAIAQGQEVTDTTSTDGSTLTPTSWMKDLNANDINLIQAMSGHTVGSDGQFHNADGSVVVAPAGTPPVTPLKAMIMSIQGGRSLEKQTGQAPDWLSDNITADQFKQLAQRGDVPAGTNPTKWNSEMQTVMQNGLSYLNSAG
jgi:hypothetical protein